MTDFKERVGLQCVEVGKKGVVLNRRFGKQGKKPNPDGFMKSVFLQESMSNIIGRCGDGKNSRACPSLHRCLLPAADSSVSLSEPPAMCFLEQTQSMPDKVLRALNTSHSWSLLTTL